MINSVVLASVQTYNPRSSLTTLTFWKNGVLMAAVDAAICFFIPFYATRTNGRLTMNDVFSVGKTVFTALLGSVTLEVWRLGATHRTCNGSSPDVLCAPLCKLWSARYIC